MIQAIPSIGRPCLLNFKSLQLMCSLLSSYHHDFDWSRFKFSTAFSRWAQDDPSLFSESSAKEENEPNAEVLVTIIISFSPSRWRLTTSAWDEENFVAPDFRWSVNLWVLWHQKLFFHQIDGDLLKFNFPWLVCGFVLADLPFLCSIIHLTKGVPQIFKEALKETCFSAFSHVVRQ